MLLMREFHGDCDMILLLQTFGRDDFPSGVHVVDKEGFGKEDCGHHGKTICLMAVIFWCIGSVLLLTKIFVTPSQGRWAY